MLRGVAGLGGEPCAYWVGNPFPFLASPDTADLPELVRSPLPPMHSNLLKLTPQKSALQPTVPGNLVGIANFLSQFCCVVGAFGVFTFDDLNAQGIHGLIRQACP